MEKYIRIISNGSKWTGQAPDSLDKLRGVIKNNQLDIRMSPLVRKSDIGGVKTWHFFGNFLTVSHVFHFVTNDNIVAAEFSELISANLERYGTTWDYNILPLDELESAGKWDYEVTVRRVADGETKKTKVSGGYPVAESYCKKLCHEIMDIADA